MPAKKPIPKRAYNLGERAQRSEKTREKVLSTARQLLEIGGSANFTMEKISAESGVSRMTLNNLFQSKEGIIKQLFDSMALSGGLAGVSAVMHANNARDAVRALIRVFYLFWKNDRLLIRRIHGIAALDPEFGKMVAERYSRRRGISEALARRFDNEFALPPSETSAALYTLTSFEFFDTLALESFAENESIQRATRLADRLLVLD